jgi:hypothetical protein
LRGLVSAREHGRLLAWDEKDWVYLLDQTGNLQGQVRPPGRLAAATAADDGSAYALCGTRGEVCWLKPDLSTVWQAAVPRDAVAAAIDPFGRFLAVSDDNGGLHVFDRHAHPVFQLQSPRPFHHMTFIPATPFLVACADYGLVACFDMKGQWIWRDGIVAHIGSLAVDGYGEHILLACYSEGMHWYGLDGKRQVKHTGTDPCRLAAVSFDACHILTAGLTDRLEVRDAGGNGVGTYICESSPVALTLSPLGNHAAAALADGTLLGMDIA